MTQPLQSSTCLHCLHLFSKQAITQASLLLTVFLEKGFLLCSPRLGVLEIQPAECWEYSSLHHHARHLL